MRLRYQVDIVWLMLMFVTYLDIARVGCLIFQDLSGRVSETSTSSCSYQELSILSLKYRQSFTITRRSSSIQPAAP